MPSAVDEWLQEWTYDADSGDDSISAFQSVESLCMRCRDLRLSMEKFIVNEASQASGTSVVTNFDPVGFGSLEFAFLDEIYANRIPCPLCCLIYNGSRSDDGSGVGHDGLNMKGERVLCSMEWHLDSRSPTSGASTRRLRVFNKTDEFPEFYIIPLLSNWSGRPSNMARSKFITSFDFELVSTWYKSCSRCHPMCGHRKEHLGPGFMPKRLIDVHNFRLCEFEDHQRPRKLAYAALSYCWGRQAPLLTKQNNIEEHKQGIQADRLQKTLLDAATIARELGIGYIWIDALCIIQDSPEDWRIEARRMDRIYTEAALTICATASDPSHGIPGLQGKRLLLPRELDIYEGLKLTTLAPVAKIINSTPWDSRAWTFQERLLSRRCLISTPEGLIWQCKSTTWREDIDASLDKDLWTLDVVGSPLQAIQGNPLRSYTSSAEIYSGRRLTIANDKVVAFEGISGALKRRLGSAFEYAMPLRYLDWALLWVEDDKLERNRYLSEIQDVERTKFPSWSWCGWNRRVNWPRSFLEGTLFNLRDWFANRTWIIWYIGGSAGWALAWNFNQELDVTLNRWDGYISGQFDCYGRSRAAAGCRFKGQVKTGNAPHPEYYPFNPTFEGRLLFQSFTGHFALSRKTMSKPNTQESRLHQFGLADSHGDWCGTVTLDKSWYNRVGGIFEFVAISEAKDFSMDELDTWTYYVSEERHQAEWYCFYALMLECKETDNGLVTERVGLAKIFQSSFFCRSLKECSWKTIVLG